MSYWSWKGYPAFKNKTDIFGTIQEIAYTFRILHIIAVEIIFAIDDFRLIHGMTNKNCIVFKGFLKFK